MFSFPQTPYTAEGYVPVANLTTEEKCAKVAFGHTVVSLGLAAAGLHHQQLLLNICHLPCCCWALGFDEGKPAALTTSSVGPAGRHEPSSMAKGGTLELINLKTLPWIGKSKGEGSKWDSKSKRPWWLLWERGEREREWERASFGSQLGIEGHFSEEESVGGRQCFVTVAQGVSTWHHGPDISLLQGRGLSCALWCV